MTTFRCPKCLSEISDTRYAKINDAGCSKCRTKMRKLYKPTKKILAEEMELAKGLYTTTTYN